MSQYQELTQELDSMNLTDNQREIVENAFFVSSKDNAIAIAEKYQAANRNQKKEAVL